MLILRSKNNIKALLFFLLFIPLYSKASLSLGLGTSSFTYGRAIPSLNLAAEVGSDWNIEVQSEGVQTPIYAQNAWTLAGYKTIHTIRGGTLGATIGAGIGTTYISRAYRTNPSAATQSDSEYVFGPYLSAKFNIGMFFVGFNTLLGLTKDIQQHILLNYQEVSHITIGVTL